MTDSEQLRDIELVLQTVTSLLGEATRLDISAGHAFNIACEHAQQLTGGTGSLIEVRDGDWMFCQGASGSMLPNLGTKLPLSNSFSGLTLRTLEPQICDDAETDPRINHDAARTPPPRSMASIPLHESGTPIGILKVTADQPHAFTRSHIERLTLIGRIVAIVICRAREAERLQELQRSLSVSEQRWRMIVDQTLAGIYVMEEGRLTFANPTLLSYLGYSAEELREIPALQLIAPPKRDAASARIADRLDGRVDSVQYETTAIRKDGSLIDIEIYGSTVELEGKRCILGTVLDITERKKATTALRRSEEWFRSLIENASDMIGVVDTAGTYLYTSPSVREQLGYEPSEMIGRSAFDFIHQDDVDRVGRELQTLVKTPSERVAIRLRFRHRTLGWRDCDVRLRVEEHEGRTVVIANTRDVTEQGHLQRQVAEAERLASLGRVASSMAHEFNNVLMAIQPYADIIARVRDEERLLKASTSIGNAVRRGRTITQQILRIMRADAPNRTRVPVQRIIHTVTEEVRSLVGPVIRLESVAPQPDLFVLADSAQIEQLIANLCLNARDAMPAGGILTIAAEETTEREFPFGVLSRTAPSFVHISVRDDGAGIPDELQHRIFEPLFTTKKAQGGTGLGLTVAQQIATSHDGALFVESRLGEGTTLHLFLPAAPPAETSTVEVASADLPENLQRILLVEDDDLVAHGLTASLGSMMLETRRVATGAAAVDAVETFRPDAVVLDYGLPDLPGTTVYKLLRSRWPKLPIVFATGHADAAVVRSEIGSEAVEICFKPFDVARLLEAIVASMRRQR